MLILTDAPERTDEWTASLIGSGSVKTSFDCEFRRRRRLVVVAPRCRPAGPSHGTGDARRLSPRWPLVIAVADAAGSAVRRPGRRASATRPRRSQPVVALALAGHGFHGNRGRPWQALPGNLHLSAAVPVDLPAATCAPVLPALAAVALTDALRRRLRPASAGADQVDQRRAAWGRPRSAASSPARSSSARGSRASWSGIGLNVRAAPAVAPTLFVPAVTCLAAHAAGAAAAAAPGALLAALLAALARRLADLAARRSRRPGRRLPGALPATSDARSPSGPKACPTPTTRAVCRRRSRAAG